MVQGLRRSARPQDDKAILTTNQETSKLFDPGAVAIQRLHASHRQGGEPLKHCVTVGPADIKPDPCT
jgi:hypothetical protein